MSYGYQTSTVFKYEDIYSIKQVSAPQILNSYKLIFDIKQKRTPLDI